MAQYQPTPTTGSEPPLDWPWYGIGFGAAIKRFFKKYAAFNGRASRGEYWWYALFSAVISAVLYVALLAITIPATMAASSSGATPHLGAGYYLVTAVASLWGLPPSSPAWRSPCAGSTTRGRPWVWILLGLIPFVGGIILIVLLVGQTAPNAEQFGPPYSQQMGPGYGAPGAYGQAYPPA